MASDRCKAVASALLFRFGQGLLGVGIVLFVISMLSAHWVVRPTVNYERENIDPNDTLVTQNFGIFTACRQRQSRGESEGGYERCGSLWDNLNFVDGDTVRFIQFLMVVAGICYVVSIALEIVQFVPIQKYRNFLAENRVVEMFGGIATVLFLSGMVIFAGEVKNKAERVPGQEEEESGWSYIMALVALILCIFGLVIVTMFRKLPIHEPGQKGGTWLRVTKNSAPAID